MKIDRKALLDAVSFAKTTAVRGNIIPVAACARIEASANSLSLRTMDFDRFTTVTVDCDGAINAHCVNVELLAAALSGIPSDVVEFSLADDRLTLTGDRAKRVLPTLPPDDFPVVPGDELNEVEVDADDLASALSFTLPAVSSELARYYLCGIYHHGDGNYIATDGGRMHWISDAPAIPGKVIIPTLMVVTMLRLLDGEKAKIGCSETLISIEVDNIRVVGKLVGGSYPDAFRAFKGNTSDLTAASAKVARAGMISASKSLTAAADPLNKTDHVLRFEAKDDKADIHLSHGATSGSDALSASTEGEMVFGFKMPQMNGALGVFSADEVTIQVSSSATLITSPEEPNRKALIMGVRI